MLIPCTSDETRTVSLSGISLQKLWIKCGSLTFARGEIATDFKNCTVKIM